MGYTLVFDVGTSSIKTTLFDEKLKVLSTSNTELKLITKPGQVIEMQVQEYWLGMCQGVRSILHECPTAKTSIKIITLTTQGETMIPVDFKGNELSNAIVWLDGRSYKEADELSTAFQSDSFYPITGVPQIDATTPISKILNIKRTQPEVYNSTSKFLLLEDYLIFRLTGKMVTEKSLMSSTGYFDINNDTLFTDILDFAEISKHLIPEVLDCGERVGKILPEVATEIGLHNGIEIFTGAMDQVAGALGAGNFNSEIMTETTGTALVVCASTKNPNFTLSTKPSIYRHVQSGNYLVLSFSETAGLILKWFKDEFCQGETEKYGSDVYVELDKMASTVAAATDGLFLLPQFSNGGGFYGITLDTKRAHIIRAILEGIAFSLQSNIEIVEEMGMRSQKIISLGVVLKVLFGAKLKRTFLEKRLLLLTKRRVLR